jgi:hypothetical protein
MTGRFYATLPSLDFLEQGIRRALERRGKAFDADQLGAVMDYVRAVVLYAPFGETMERAVSYTSCYDVDAWARDGYREPLARYAQDERTRTAEVDPRVRALIESKVATFGEHPSGLGKFTRTMFARQLRRSLEPLEPLELGEEARHSA